MSLLYNNKTINKKIKSKFSCNWHKLCKLNRAYNKSDYLPCIAWGRNARFAKSLTVGANVLITGRIQSREYQKKLNDNQILTKTAYEISISQISNANAETPVDVQEYYKV